MSDDMSSELVAEVTDLFLLFKAQGLTEAEFADAKAAIGVDEGNEGGPSTTAISGARRARKGAGAGGMAQVSNPYGSSPPPKFFQAVAQDSHGGRGGLHHREYIVIVDQSGSMRTPDQDKDFQTVTRWDNAGSALKVLAPKIASFDPDGFTMYFFSSPGKLQRYPNMSDPRRVQEIFRSNPPQRGNTDLTGALDAAFQECSRSGKPTTILVITDGEPNDRDSARRSIERHSNTLRSDEQCSVTFVQVGDDKKASQYLASLDDDLRCKFDIVDTIKDDILRQWGFERLIEMSIQD